MANKRREHHEEHIDETWLIPYADLLTLLLALFIVLFASSTIDSQKFNSMKESLNAALHGGQGINQLQSSTEQIIEKPDVQSDVMVDLQKLKKQMDQYIQENNMSMELESSIVNQSLVITIRDHALFDSGSAIVKPAARKIIVSMSDILAQYPKYEIVVTGHTDNRPINTRQFESNWDLSTERALNCMKILLQNKGLNPMHFSAIGYGEYRPIASNDTEEGKAKNRRVEVKIKQPSIN